MFEFYNLSLKDLTIEISFKSFLPSAYCRKSKILRSLKSLLSFLEIAGYNMSFIKEGSHKIRLSIFLKILIASLATLLILHLALLN